MFTALRRAMVLLLIVLGLLTIAAPEQAQAQT